jgi:hypothetical protein
MRSRSWLEHSGLALGAAAEGIWCGALAAALTGASWAALTVFACVTVAAAAHVARRLGRGEGRERAARLAALTLILVMTGVLFLAGRSWMPPGVLWQVVRDVVYVSGLVLVGISLGRDSRAPEAAVRRAVRAFALLCAVLVCAALAGSAPGWASAALVAVLVAGGLLIAVVRYQSLTDLVDAADRLPAWPWLLTVTGAVLGVIAIGALLSQVLSLDVLHWALGVIGGVLRFALDGIAYLIGYAGAGLIRGLTWLLDALHVHARPEVEVPESARRPPVLKLRHAEGNGIWSGMKPIATSLGALAAIGLSLALVVLALRHFRRELPAEVAVQEEREALTSLRSAAGESAARLGRRLRRRLQALRRQRPLTPAELVRRRYVELEQRLSRAGQARLPGVTVRDYLVAVAALPETSASPPPQSAADLAALYEVARYSNHAVDSAQAQRFEALARGLEV